MENKKGFKQSRREFCKASGIGAAVLGMGITGLSLDSANASEVGPIGNETRANRAFQIRQQAAIEQKQLPLPEHPDNGDEALFPNKIANYSKGLPHNNL